MTRSERVLRPLCAFWLPFAYQNGSEVSSTELQQLARSAIYQLKLHIQYLEDSFGLNSSSALAELTQAEEKGFLVNGRCNSENFEETEDFSNEDDILSQLS